MLCVILATALDPPRDFVVGSIRNRTNNSTVTIEWTPPPGESIMYTISVLPPPLSMDTSSSQTSTTITVLYNTKYEVNLLDSVCGGQTAINFTLGQH